MICAGFLWMKALTSLRSHSLFLGVDVGASRGKPGSFTSTSLAWRSLHLFMAAMSASVIRSFICVFPCFFNEAHQ